MVKLRKKAYKNGPLADSVSAVDSGIEDSVFSCVAEGTKIQGDLEFSGKFSFAGELEGSIHARDGRLEIAKRGNIHGDIECQKLECHGQIVGSVQAYSNITFCKDCSLVGDIKTKELSIHSGARIHGHCNMLGKDDSNIDFFSVPIESLRKQLKLKK